MFLFFGVVDRTEAGRAGVAIAGTAVAYSALKLL